MEMSERSVFFNGARPRTGDLINLSGSGGRYQYHAIFLDTEYNEVIDATYCVVFKQDGTVGRYGVKYWDIEVVNSVWNP
jgi:hypothetical protein